VSTQELLAFDRNYQGPHDELYFTERAKLDPDAPTNGGLPILLEVVRAVDSSPDDDLVVAPPAEPMPVARQLVAEKFTDDNTMVIRSWRGSFSAWGWSLLARA